MEMDKTETLDVREAPLDFALEEDAATQDVPAYLRETYWWAYLHPRAVKIFEHVGGSEEVQFSHYEEARLLK